MVTLDPQSGDLVLINTFTVDPDKADALLSALSKATENGMKQRPRFHLGKPARPPRPDARRQLRAVAQPGRSRCDDE
jgi:hypothetical protein